VRVLVPLGAMTTVCPAGLMLSVVAVEPVPSVIGLPDVRVCDPITRPPVAGVAIWPPRMILEVAGVASFDEVPDTRTTVSPAWLRLMVVAAAPWPKVMGGPPDDNVLDSNTRPPVIGVAVWPPMGITEGAGARTVETRVPTVSSVRPFWSILIVERPDFSPITAEEPPGTRV
jgi:hypothetical protein